MAANGSEEALMWGVLWHLGYNMWSDRKTPEREQTHIDARDHLRFDEPLWADLLSAAVGEGLNTVVLDLGEGVRYESHPELAVEGSWSPERLHEELGRLREMGLEPLPKLNFSTAHDAWLGPYARAVSTPEYYAVCRDLIAEVIDLFDRPRLFHLGMDEETAQHQRYYSYAVIRQYDLWWHDLYYYIDQVERGGVRPWVWSDYVWHHPEAFYRNMPTSVLQSNWYYQDDFGPEASRAQAYADLEAHGFDQVPTGSNWATDANMGLTVEFCQKTIAPERLKGFLQTIWRPTLEPFREKHLEGVRQLGEAKRRFEAAAKE
ncbi:MAG: Tat pathway signal protein [Chloroflexi bacterium]|nr:Tat pathway signal protein [Chloroflexota bacterium]